MISKLTECFKLFEQFINYIDRNNGFLKKISGDVHSSLGIKLIKDFSNDDDCTKKVKEDVEKFSKILELVEYGYFDLNKLDNIDKNDMLIWFSNFIFDNSRTVGKGEVLLSILFSNVFKTPLGENYKETGDLFISEDGGETVSGRIEVKSALPGGLKFADLIRLNSIKKVDDGEKLVKVYKKFSESPLGNSAIDKDMFIRLCAYCIARYMHGQFPKEENYWLVIFDNQPHINTRGNIHDSESIKIKRIINDDGKVIPVKESTDNSFDVEVERTPLTDFFDKPYSDPNDVFLKGDNEQFTKPEEDVLLDAPTESTNGNDEIKVKNIDGFLYIKRCKTVNETMKRIIGLIDDKSSIYKENKSKSSNNFTFYVKDERIHIAHRDNPSLIVKKRRKKKGM